MLTPGVSSGGALILSDGGTPTPNYSVTSGALPLGLSLDSTTGGITGTPTTPGASTFLVTVSNGGSGSSPAFATAAVAVLLGGTLVVLAPRSRRRRH